MTDATLSPSALREHKRQLAIIEHNTKANAVIARDHSRARSFCKLFLAEIAERGFYDARTFLDLNSSLRLAVNRCAEEILWLAFNETRAPVKRALIHAAERVLCVDTREYRLTMKEDEDGE